jgi:hypothetical protein
MQSFQDFDANTDSSDFMGHVILDRRQEPRFALPGVFKVVAETAIAGRVLDVSVNGALLEQQEGSLGAIGNQVEMWLELDGSRPITALARVAHIEGKRIGVEFQEIGPADFDHLANLVLALKRAPTLAKLMGG